MRTSVRLRMIRPMGRCSRCKEEKPDEEFAWRRRARGQRDNYCRPCRAAYKQEHYRANKQRYIELRGDERKLMLEERIALSSSPTSASTPASTAARPIRSCSSSTTCGTRSSGSQRAFRDRNWHDVLDEIAKCEVVCANCHRRRTARRGGFLRAAVAQR